MIREIEPIMRTVAIEIIKTSGARCERPTIFLMREVISVSQVHANREISSKKGREQRNVEAKVCRGNTGANPKPYARQWTASGERPTNLAQEKSARHPQKIIGERPCTKSRFRTRRLSNSFGDNPSHSHPAF